MVLHTVSAWTDNSDKELSERKGEEESMNNGKENPSQSSTRVNHRDVAGTEDEGKVI